MISRRFPTVLVAAAAAHACTVHPEQTIVGDFFAASRLRDLTALSRFATLVFEPRERGTIVTFTILGVSDEHSEGGLQVKDVAIDATVRTPDGETVQKPFVVRLQRRGRDSGAEPPAIYDGWIVTGVTDGPASPPL
ncbi:MAG: hypothetical protein GEU82_12705 [Luteitalea sp.]|nr:hypothetical protein [Luteitalea sp.]